MSSNQSYGFPVTQQPLADFNQAQIVSTQYGQTQQYYPPNPSTQICPKGLEKLAPTDQIIFKQYKSPVELICGWTLRKQYTIYNGSNEPIFSAIEDSACCSRPMGPGRMFEFTIRNNEKEEVLKVDRTKKVVIEDTGKWRADTLVTSTFEGIELPLGYVEATRIPMTIRLVVHNVDSVPVFSVDLPSVPICICNCCGTQDYEFYDIRNQRQDGYVTRYADGCCDGVAENFNFKLTFPLHLDVNLKALLLGTILLLDVAHTIDIYSRHTQM